MSPERAARGEPHVPARPVSAENATAKVTAKDAPAFTPRMPGSASGLRVKAWISAPHTPSAGPTTRPTSCARKSRIPTIACASDPSKSKRACDDRRGGKCLCADHHDSAARRRPAPPGRCTRPTVRTAAPRDVTGRSAVRLTSIDTDQFAAGTALARASARSSMVEGMLSTLGAVVAHARRWSTKK